MMRLLKCSEIRGGYKRRVIARPQGRSPVRRTQGAYLQHHRKKKRATVQLAIILVIALAPSFAKVDIADNLRVITSQVEGDQEQRPQGQNTNILISGRDFSS